MLKACLLKEAGGSATLPLEKGGFVGRESAE